MKRVNVLWRTALALSLLSLATLALQAADETKKTKEDREPDVIYVPTPQEVVNKMLETAKVTKDDVVYDLGCGDGRIVLTAARKYKCKAKGFDIDKKRISECMANFKKEDKETQKRASFERKDIFTLDLTGATVITLYLLPELNARLVPQLKKCKAGTRVVSHDFPMPGYKPDKKLTIDTKEHGEKTVYLFTLPLKPDGSSKE